MESSGQDTGVLWRASTDLVGAANEVVARHAALRRKWRPKDAQRARDRLCDVLQIAVDERLWGALRDVVRGEPDPMLIEGLRALDLAAFAELERELYEAAGADPALADTWSAATTTLLEAIARASDDKLVHELWGQIPQARAHVVLARERVCTEALPDLVPIPRLRGGAHARETNKERSRRFRSRLFGGGQVVLGVGTIAGNAAAMAGAAPIPLVNVPAGIFGAGSVLGGIGTVLSGAKALVAGD